MALHHLTTLEQLDTLLTATQSRPLILFKHSETCGMSLQAHAEVCEAVRTPGFDTDVYLVSVQASRSVSNAIASRFRVGHQSPQVLLVHAGEVRWHTSHLAITANALGTAVERLDARVA